MQTLSLTRISTRRLVHTVELTISADTGRLLGCTETTEVETSVEDYADIPCASE